MKTEHRKVCAATVKTVGPEHPIWKTDDASEPGVEGSFVRLDPPPNHSDDDVEHVRRLLVRDGALAVKVLPVRRDAVVGVHVAGAPSVEQPHLSARSLVMEILTEARSQEPELLRKVAEEAMAEARL